MNFVLNLCLLAVCAFFQNMAFTWVSRSRNSGDPYYHRKAAYCSNGIWFVTHFLVLRQVWEVLEDDISSGWWKLLILGIVYAIATAEGSVLMMKRLLKSESGSRRVGANASEK